MTGGGEIPWGQRDQRGGESSVINMPLQTAPNPQKNQQVVHTLHLVSDLGK